ncbi:MAG: glutathione S-transferase N-terminal domain-containing protein [Gammaproteobacteria bacterium]|nr:glutathione S-transferase N-terminal domain-containing protein [Gammaproteobacteria bacterium]
MKIIRWVLGRIILLLNFIFSPKKAKHDAQQQARLDAECASLALYQFEACPFCVKVRRAVRRLGLNIEIRDTRKEGRYRDELLQEGGEIKVPCLRISEEDGSVRWMYESSDIIAYLQQRFAAA